MACPPENQRRGHSVLVGGCSCRVFHRRQQALESACHVGHVRHGLYNCVDVSASACCENAATDRSRMVYGPLIRTAVAQCSAFRRRW